MAKQSKSADKDSPCGKSSKGKDPELLELGNRLRELRDAAGLTQEALAHAADLHWTYIGQIERGERNLTYKSLLRLAKGLGLDPQDLLPGGRGP